jgi:hypothetical protein
VIDNKEQLCLDIYKSMIATKPTFQYYMPRIISYITENEKSLSVLFEWMNQNPQNTKKLFQIAIQKIPDPNSRKENFLELISMANNLFGFNLIIMNTLRELHQKFKLTFPPRA